MQPVGRDYCCCDALSPRRVPSPDGPSRAIPSAGNLWVGSGWRRGRSRPARQQRCESPWIWVNRLEPTRASAETMTGTLPEGRQIPREGKRMHVGLRGHPCAANYSLNAAKVKVFLLKPRACEADHAGLTTTRRRSAART